VTNKYHHPGESSLKVRIIAFPRYKRKKKIDIGDAFEYLLTESIPGYFLVRF
jgi:hypothetical protein